MAEPASLPTRTGTRNFNELMKDGSAPFFTLLQHPEMQRRMAQALPRHLSPERMIRVCALALQKTPKLAEVDRATLLGALLTCGSLGLEPNTVLGHAYLIPYGKACQLVLGYKGLADLARRSGRVGHIHADVVYQGDDFQYHYGVGADLKHRPKGARSGQWLYAYAIAEITGGGGWQFEVLTYEEVMAVRNKSQGYLQALRETDVKKREKAPWIGFEAEMAKKTAFRRLAKMLPLSVEYASAAALDEMADSGRQDLSALSDATDINWALEDHASDEQDGTPATPMAGDAGGRVPPQAQAAQAAGGADPQPAPPAVDRAYTGHVMPNTTGPGINLADQPVSMLASIKAGIDSSNSAGDLEGWWRYCDEPAEEGAKSILEGLTKVEYAEALQHKLGREELLNKRSRGR